LPRFSFFLAYYSDTRPFRFTFFPFSHTCIYNTDLKKVTKLEAMIPYHEGRNAKDEAQKVRDQIGSIWDKARADFAAQVAAGVV
jgi:hypothetical protein